MGLEMVGRLGRRMGRAGESGEMMTGGGGGGGRGKFLHTGEIEFLIGRDIVLEIIFHQFLPRPSL